MKQVQTKFLSLALIPLMAPCTCTSTTASIAGTDVPATADSSKQQRNAG